MSSIFSLLTIGNAIAEISAGYAKLLEGNGSAGPAGAALQAGGNALGTLMQTVDSSNGESASSAGNQDHYEFSRTAMDYAFAFQTQQAPPVLDVQATTDTGIAPTATDAGLPTSATPSRPYQPNAGALPAIQTLANLNNPYPFGNEAIVSMLDVYG